MARRPTPRPTYDGPTLIRYGDAPRHLWGDEDSGFERSEDRAALEPALERLAPREREILRMRFEEGLPQTQIAQRVGLSQMHVSRLIRKSLAVMREELLR